MGSNIYTRQGDQGETSLADGIRISKNAPRVEAYGTVDEANSWVGLVRAHLSDPYLSQVIEFLQHRLYNCSANLASGPNPDHTPPQVTEGDVLFLERAIDHLEERTGALHAFILPAGGQTASLLHLARTVCRRAERRIITLAAAETVDPLVLKFINRSSDLLFAAARYANNLEGIPEVLWNKTFTGVSIP